MTEVAPALDAFRHEALLYAGEDGFVEGAGAFIRDGLEAGDAMLVVVSTARIDRLRQHLGSGAREPALRFADMAEVGANPARIIPAWQAWVKDAGPERSLRGIGEPIWSGRSPDELVECERHEALLNLAFEGGRPWWLLCPYDTASLDPAVVERARTTHPHVGAEGAHQPSEGYHGVSTWFEQPLPEPRGAVVATSFDAAGLGALRALVSRQAARYGLSARRVADLVLAANEVATNSLRHGGGGGGLRIWQEDAAVVCEVRDQGVIASPLADRTAPGHDPDAPRGLWTVNQLCDLVQLRTSPAGTVVRLHVRRQ